MVKLSAVWDDTVTFFADNLSIVVPISVASVFLPLSISTNLQASIDSDESSLLLALVDLALSLIVLWGGIAISAMALGAARIEQASRLATQKFLPVLGVMVLAIMVIALPGILLFFGPQITQEFGGEPVNLGLPESLFLLCLLAGVIVVSSRLLLVVPVILRDGMWFGAIAESWTLTRGMTLRLVGLLLLYALVSWVSALAAVAVFGSIFALVVSGGGGQALATLLTSIVAGAVTTVFTVFLPVFSAKLYLALIAPIAHRG